MNLDDYMKERVDDQINWLSRESGKNQSWFKKLRAAETRSSLALKNYYLGFAQAVAR